MKNIIITKRGLHMGTAVIWAGVLLGVSLFTEAEQGRNLDWELMWLIIGGFLIQTSLINFYIKGDKS